MIDACVVTSRIRSKHRIKSGGVCSLTKGTTMNVLRGVGGSEDKVDHSRMPVQLLPTW